MTIAGTSLTANSDTTNTNTFTTGTFAFNQGDFVLVGLANTKGTTPEKATPSCSTAQTFAEVDDVLFNTVASPTMRLTLWSFVADSTQSGRTITFDFSGVNQTGCMWAVRKYTATGAVTVRQHGTNRNNTSSGLTVTLGGAAADANSMMVGFFAAAQASGVAYTAGSGFTLRQNPTGMATPSTRILNEDQIGTDVSIDVTSDGGNAGIAVIGVELVEAATNPAAPASHQRRLLMGS